jgi:hypothetical protein
MNNEDIISTATILSDLKRLKKAISNIEKNRRTWKKFKKAAQAGVVSEERLAAAKSVLEEATKDALAIAFESGFAIGQGDDLDWNARAEVNARDIIS